MPWQWHLYAISATIVTRYPWCSGAFCGGLDHSSSPCATCFFFRAVSCRSHARLVLRDLNMRVPILWLAFWMLFAFWFAAFFLNLRGGVTTYSLVVVGIALFLKRSRVNAR